MPGIIYDGDGDINFTGVVGSTGTEGREFSELWNNAKGSVEDGETLEGVHHWGQGNVWINGRQSQPDADGS